MIISHIYMITYMIYRVYILTTCMNRGRTRHCRHTVIQIYCCAYNMYSFCFRHVRSSEECSNILLARQILPKNGHYSVLNSALKTVKKRPTFCWPFNGRNSALKTAKKRRPAQWLCSVYCVLSCVMCIHKRNGRAVYKLFNMSKKYAPE